MPVFSRVKCIFFMINAQCHAPYRGVALLVTVTSLLFILILEEGDDFVEFLTECFAQQGKKSKYSLP